MTDIETRGFFEARNAQDYQEVYQKLVNGLDEKSIDVINRVLSRHSLVHGKRYETIDLWTIEEQQIIDRQRRTFYSNTLKIADNIYACGKYLVCAPESGLGNIETSVFVDSCGFGVLEHPERIKDKDILDLGAFVGDSALVLGKRTNKKVYAFEPSTPNFKMLLKTIELNHMETKIIPINAGVGSTKGEAQIQSCVGMWMGLKDKTECQNVRDDFETVNVITVDDFVAENKINVGLIKVDVEGFEQQVLKGAERTLREQWPALLLSMYHNASDFYNLKPMLEDMELGYRFKVHKEINERIHYDTMLIAEVE